MGTTEDRANKERLQATRFLGHYRVSRRGLFAATGAVVLAPGVETLGIGSEARAETVKQVIAGPIRGIGSVGVFHIATLGPGSRVVEVRPAWPLSESESTYFSTLRLGDEVAVEGDWSGDDFLAVSVGPLYRDVQVTVIHRRGNQLTTMHDTIRLTDKTRSVESYAGHPVDIDAIGAGSSVAIEGIRDPATGELVATRISGTALLA